MLRSFAIFSIAAITGCGSSPETSFYVLDPVAPAGPATGAPIALGVGPIELPAYLDRPQIVTRGASTELKVADFDQWAEPLQDGFTRVLGENLARILGTDRIHPYPWAAGVSVDYHVQVRVLRFDAREDGGAELAASWTLSRGDGTVLVPMKKSEISVPATTPDFAATTAAMSRAVAELASEIAGNIR